MGQTLGLVGFLFGAVGRFRGTDLEKLVQPAANGGVHAGGGQLLDWKTPDFPADFLSDCRVYAGLRHQPDSDLGGGNRQ